MSTRRCHCGAPIHPWQTECSHRRACEARHLLIAGEQAAVAAAHAQRLNTPAQARAIRNRVRTTLFTGEPECDWCEGVERLYGGGLTEDGIPCPICWPGMYLELAELPATAAEFVAAYIAQPHVRADPQGPSGGSPS